MDSNNRANRSAFTLPAILITSIVLLAVLTVAISSTISVKQALDDQHYTRIAELAGEAGTAYAKACLGKNNNAVTWSDETPLKPNTDCFGTVQPAMPAYIQENQNYRVYFTVSKPPLNSNGQPVSLAGQGFVEVLRSSTGIAWRTWSSEYVSAQSGSGSGIPVGTYLDGAWTTAPEGYLLADGSAVSRTTYANLFNVIGTTYGAGNGSTTFNLPDSRGRVLVDKTTSGTFNTLGKKGGSETHTLTVAEMPSHQHSLRRFTGDADDFLGGSSAPYGLDSSWAASGTQYTNIMSPSGGNQPHNNIQPYIVVTRVIKY